MTTQEQFQLNKSRNVIRIIVVKLLRKQDRLGPPSAPFQLEFEGELFELRAETPQLPPFYKL
nr:MAG TPA: hypothetical protein [Caudoviricetes sp.]DAT87492.1 MAG TPA: hypothetical protein [Caudoviricetes sp.]